MMKVRIFGILTRSNFERTTRFPLNAFYRRRKKKGKKKRDKVYRGTREMYNSTGTWILIVAQFP